MTEGFALIVARIPGTAFEARTVINVTGSSTGGGGEGGGGGGSASVPAAPSNTPPVIQQLTSSSSTVIGGGVAVKMTGGATDAQSLLADSQFSWTCSPLPDCGSFSPATGPTVYWQSPATGGSYQITLTVNDGSLSSTQNVTVIVQTGSGNLQINPP